MDDRATSVQIGYTLSLAITAVLISGVLITAGGVVDSRQEQTVRSELTVVGERIAADLMTADRLATAGGSEVRVDVSLPARVAGASYRVTVDTSASPPRLVLTSDDPSVTVTVAFDSTTAVDAGTIAGGDLRIVLTPSDTLEVRST
ncbi:hypothetical protein ACFQPA_06550 [Halomarina halobia]|uniref:Flagellin n=1 Tax=Halomarina halobia TaxID=3033386 RepID=A0ABD6A656_9EURY|nr:hypothetical protein [Halomarina sp. PSR21]